MKYLIDTQTYLWFRIAPELLPPKCLDLLTDTEHTGFLSVVTPWELAVKSSAGKLDVAALLVDFEQRETEAGFCIAGITVGQAIASGLLPRHHRDPFDRLLVAQALDMRTPLLSRDTSFDHYGVERIWH